MWRPTDENPSDLDPPLALVLSLVVAGATAGPSRSDSPLDIGSRLELFVDDYLIEDLAGTRLVLHHPRPAEVVLRFQRPWEGAFCAYVTVIKDGEKYRMYYQGEPNATPDGTGDEVTCYETRYLASEKQALVHVRESSAATGHQGVLNLLPKDFQDTVNACLTARRQTPGIGTPNQNRPSA